MNANDDLELRLHAWMASTAPNREPVGLVERAMAATSRTGQRPRVLATRLGRPSRLGTAAASPALRLVLVALAVAAALAASAYVGSRLLHTPEPLPRVERHHQLTPVSGGPITRQWLGALSDGRVLVAPVHGGDGHASLWDPAAGTMTPTGTMVAPDRSVSGVTLDDGRLLLAGGDYVYGAGGDGSPSGDPTAEVYDPSSGTFTSLGRLPDPIYGGSAVRLADGRVLLTGGLAAPGEPPGRPSAASEIFDPSTNTFMRTGGPIQPRANADAVTLADGRVLVVGGRLAGPNGIVADGPETLSAEIYDPATGRFTPTGSLPAIPSDTAGYRYPLGEWGPLVALPDGRALVVGLRCQEVHDVVGGVSAGAAPTATYVYDPRPGTFTAGPLLPHCVERAYTLPDGRVFVVGWWYEGADSVTESDGTVVMSGEQKTWSAVLDAKTGTLTDAGVPPRDALYVYAWWLPLPDGRLLVRAAYRSGLYVLEP